MSKNRPPRHPAQTSKLTDANNTAQPELSFQRKPVHTRRAQENLSVPNSVQYPPTVAVPEYTIHATSCVESSEDEDIDDQSRPCMFFLLKSQIKNKILIHFFCYSQEATDHA